MPQADEHLIREMCALALLCTPRVSSHVHGAKPRDRRGAALLPRKLHAGTAAYPARSGAPRFALHGNAHRRAAAT